MLSLILAASLVQPSFDRVPLRDNALFDDLGQYWNEQMTHYGVSSYAVAAIKDGELVLLDAVGKLAPFSDRKADIDTRYYIASITKTMTAAAIAQLAEQGKLSLDDPVQKYLPRFTLDDKEFAKTVTIRDLMSHKPGITGGRVVLLDAYTGGITEDRFYTIVGASEPTKKVQYTNVHFTILGRVIEAVTGTPWQDHLDREVFERAGMDRTTAYVSTTHNDPNVAPPLVLSANGVESAPIMKTDRTMHAAGGVISTPRDMARYLYTFLNEGRFNGSVMLRPETLREAVSHQSQTEVQGSIRKISGYGYAWNVGDYRDTKGFAAHGGGYVGYMAYIAMVPEKKTGAIVMVNTGGPGGEFGTIVAVDLLDRLLGYPVDTRLRDIYRTVVAEHKGVLAARKSLGPNPTVSGGLSQQPEQYAGVYRNELLGDLRVSFEGGYLKLAWGDLPMTLSSTGTDVFKAHDDDSDSGTPGRFVTENGKVIGIELTLGEEKQSFIRAS